MWCRVAYGYIRGSYARVYATVASTAAHPTQPALSRVLSLSLSHCRSLSLSDTLHYIIGRVYYYYFKDSLQHDSPLYSSIQFFC